MTDEGDSLGDQSLTRARDRRGQAPDGQRAGSGTGDAGGTSMNGTSPQDPAGPMRASRCRGVILGPSSEHAARPG